jgi:hypothetical protein
VRNGISSWTIFPARPGSKPETQADELGMLLQTEFHYPKRSKKIKTKKKDKVSVRRDYVKLTIVLVKTQKKSTYSHFSPGSDHPRTAVCRFLIK